MDFNISVNFVIVFEKFIFFASIIIVSINENIAIHNANFAIL